MALSFANWSLLDKNVVDVLDDLELSLWSTTPNLAGNCDTVEGATVGEDAAEVMAMVQAIRNRASGQLTEDRVVEALLPVVREGCVTIGAPEGRNVDFDAGVDRLRDYFVANSKTVNSRSQTFGAVSAVTGTGTGTVRYLTVDDEGFRLEGSHNETKTFTCLLDQSNVEKHFEEFEVKGAVPYRDGLKRTGSGLVGKLVCLTTRNSQRYINNPSFSQYTGTTQPTASSEQTITSAGSSTTDSSIAGWVADATTNIKVSVDTVYRDLATEPAASRISVKFEGSAYIYQQFNRNLNPQFKQRVPYHVQVAVYRGSSCDGNLVITFGATTRTVDMTTLSNGAWNVVTLTFDKGLYARNFRSNDMQLKFQLSSRTTGHLYLDDVIIEEMTPIDGLFYVVVGGATPFVRNDYQTIAVSEATRGTRSYWWNLRSGRGRRGGFSLPSDTGGTETEVDP